MQEPHGGALVNRFYPKEIDLEDANVINVNQEIADDIENIAHGVFSPLEGFMCYNDLESVMDRMRLENDIPWTIPIILDVNQKTIEGLREGDTTFLVHGKSSLLASIEIEEIFSVDRKRLAEKIFGTKDPSHPGVKMVLGLNDRFVGGKITLFREAKREFGKLLLWPKETRSLFKERGWKEIVAFQTRNPPHMGHEYVQKVALTLMDGLFINPIIGRKRKGDFRNEVVLASYEALIKNYYPKERVILSILCTSMKYAGPREAVHHAIMRKNFGCTHFIVGRDHAGVGNFYKPYDAHEIFANFPDLGITPIFFKSFFYCRKCGGVVNEKVCPHGEEDRINFSGTEIRSMLKQGKIPPPEVMRPEVAQAILKFSNPFIE